MATWRVKNLRGTSSWWWAGVHPQYCEIYLQELDQVREGEKEPL